jgi:hypothetical protein
MTVAELIEQLQQMPPEATVIVGAGSEIYSCTGPAEVIELEFDDGVPEVWILGN